MELLDTNGKTDIRLRNSFLSAMSKAVTPVTIVTTDGAHGKYGQTISAMCSVTADAPTVLVCVNTRSPLADAVVGNGRFAVSMLSNMQSSLANRFAGRSNEDGDPYAFDVSDWTVDGHGLPVVRHASSIVSCALDGVTEVGTHLVLFGRVLDAAHHTTAALGYSDRCFGSIS